MTPAQVQQWDTETKLNYFQLFLDKVGIGFIWNYSIMKIHKW